MRKTLLTLAVAFVSLTITAYAANPIVTYDRETYVVNPSAVLVTDGSSVFRVDRTQHTLHKMTLPEIAQYTKNFKGKTIRIERLALLGDAIVVQGQRDFNNGTPLYDSNGYRIGRRVYNSATGDYNNLGPTGRMLPPWQQW
jgi:hypothetical protein